MNIMRVDDVRSNYVGMNIVNLKHVWRPMGLAVGIALNTFKDQ